MHTLKLQKWQGQIKYSQKINCDKVTLFQGKLVEAVSRDTEVFELCESPVCKLAEEDALKGSGFHTQKYHTQTVDITEASQKYGR